jgi:hypothetical protein
MQKQAAVRAGGVIGDATPVDMNTSKPVSVPMHLQKTMKKSATLKTAMKGGRLLCLVKLLDGEVMQLYAEAGTTGANFLDQVALMLKAYEKYYFGFRFVDSKGEEDWIKLDKKLLKHDFPKKADHIEIELRVRFFPIDATQVLQYVTLYQCFLTARNAVLGEELLVSSRDAMLLAALSLQATKGDYNAKLYPPGLISPIAAIPARTMAGYRLAQGQDAHTFWVGEVIRVWSSVTGILKHLAVLKYMQIVQKHRNFAMKLVEVKNKKGTPLTIGIHPTGLNVFRLGEATNPVVRFGWAECSELSYTEKKFKIEVHDRETKAFSVYCSRAQICQQVLHLCIGLHRLYVQDVRKWENAPADLAAMRSDAAKASVIEREELKTDASRATEKASAIRVAQSRERMPTMWNRPEGRKGVAPAASATATADTAAELVANMAKVELGGAAPAKGGEVVDMMDMMMNDKDFMKFQNTLLVELEEGLGDGYTEILVEDEDAKANPAFRERCQSEAIKDRAAYLESMGHA